MTLYFDGGMRPDPAVQGRDARRDARRTGRMELAVVVGDRVHIVADAGQGDSCTAEWLALRHAVAIALAAGASDVTLIGDALTVVEQARGRWRCRNAASQPQLAAYRAAIAPFARVHVRHVARAKNLAGIALASRHTR